MEFREENIKKIKDYCMSLPGVYETRPFGIYPICYRIMGKIFAQLNPEENFFKITIKCQPEQAEIYRSLYPNVVVRGYHCPPVQQPYWNTIDLYEFHNENLLMDMIKEGYDAVVSSLTRKNRNLLPCLCEVDFKNVDGKDEDFIALCHKLDDDLSEIAGGQRQRENYEQYNKTDQIHNGIVAYMQGRPIACGAFKIYDDAHAEVKCIFTEYDFRGKGIGAELLRRLEAQAKIKGFHYCVLETGDILEAACRMYKRAGYKIIPNYGQYANMPQSVCMSKKI